MKNLFAKLAVVLVALGTVGAAQAQQPSYSLGLFPSHSYPQQHYGYGYHHASTAAEGYARGIAAMTNARGHYNRLTAEATAIYAEARARAIKNRIENRQQAAETYFAMRKANQEARAALRGPRPTPEALARFAKQAAPKRLGPAELSTITGKVSWPALLRSKQYATYRMELEYAFAQRVNTGMIAAEDQVKVRRTAKAMLAELKKSVREVDPMQYAPARRFVKSLSYEAQLPVS